MTVTNCLVHAAGYPPDPVPCYWDPSFGCDGSPLPTEPTFDCAEKIFASLNNQTLIRPINTEYQYSDLSMITLMYVVGAVVKAKALVAPADLLPDCVNAGPGLELQCHYEAFIRTQILHSVGMVDSGFRPAASVQARCAPTAVPHGEGTGFRTLQGQVNDGNSFLLGGISGHAGLFSTVGDLEKLVHQLLGIAPSGFGFLNSTTVQKFTAVHNATQSTRALGWDTDESLCGSVFPAATFTHTGYTGTQICGDLANKKYTILLTNRVYPVDSDESEAHISALRKAFNTAAATHLGEGKEALV